MQAEFNPILDPTQNDPVVVERLHEGEKNELIQMSSNASNKAVFHQVIFSFLIHPMKLFYSIQCTMQYM